MGGGEGEGNYLIFWGLRSEAGGPIVVGGGQSSRLSFKIGVCVGGGGGDKAATEHVQGWSLNIAWVYFVNVQQYYADILTLYCNIIYMNSCAMSKIV